MNGDVKTTEIDDACDRLSKTFKSSRSQSLAYRMYNLKMLAFLLSENESKILDALKTDLGKEAFEARVSDILPVIGEIELAVRSLPEWIKDERATRNSTHLFKLMRPRVVKQPKGVSLIIGSWGMPFHLVLSPLVGAIAAGCPTIIKPSEKASECAKLLASLFPQYLDPDGFTVVNGGPEVATYLLQKRWGHVLFTGSESVGRQVAEAAGKTLTPTTLELGGKCPVIVAPDSNFDIIARRMLSVKQLGLGQLCVSPDYVLCPKDIVDQFIEALIRTLDDFFPKLSNPSILGESSPAPTPPRGHSLISDQTHACKIRTVDDYDRLEAAIDFGETTKKIVYRGETDRSKRRMGISIVKLNRGAVGEEGILANEEIFGPILPIIPVDDVDAAIRFVNARPAPLALYICSSNRAIFDKVVADTLSGSVIWNDFGLSPISRTLPYGGVGESGWGAYHGYDGFLTFSHRKAVMEVPLLMEFIQRKRYPPISERYQRMIGAVTAPSIAFDRPESIEAERRRIERSRSRKHLYIGMLTMLCVILGAWLGMYLRKNAHHLNVPWRPKPRLQLQR